MRSEIVIIMREQRKPLADAPSTVHPRIVEAVDSHFERVKPLFDEASVGVVDLTAQHKS